MHNSFCSRGQFIGFILCRVSGFLLGFLLAVLADCSLLSWMPSILLARLSILWSLIRNLFPFLIAYFAIRYNRYEILLLLIWLTGCSYGCLLGVVLRAYGSASWLIALLGALTDPIRQCMVDFLVLGYIRHDRNGSVPFLRCALIAVVFAITEIYCIAPLLELVLIN